MTKEVKHTPAPWHVGGYENLTIYGNDDSDGDPVVLGGLRYNGHAMPFNHSVYSTPQQKIQKANARIIAAAPELLEALELIYTDFICGEKGRGISAEGILEICSKAIAKAEGK